ncbi:hypothetical protein PVIIG_06554 [Plasmodium vivax India VII]|uniref:Vir protein n=1 Tax=Plasmodium vivax India VII TaxID=1077284 RepID=A0A0J9S2N5_PLAVI|nr:hypothetical protein PVIIG_06554 [Plasmodium vivax India VII]
MKFFYAFYKKSMFDLKNKCSIAFINDNIRKISCNKVEEQSKTIVASEGAAVSASSSAERADQHGGEGATETGVFQASGDDDGLDDPGRDNPIPEDLEISLAFNEDPPKLDTTYAAASLAGISLFGTIIYKYGPFRNRFNSRRGAINGSNIFPLDNNVYDANTMNNFEYLQTGISNDEYQLGYGSVTDY